MSTYPRTQNGYIDSGREIGKDNRCPNCGSSNFRVTVSREYCPDCGIECDYWGGGSNASYDAMVEGHNSELDQIRQEVYAREKEDWDADLFDDELT